MSTTAPKKATIPAAQAHPTYMEMIKTAIGEMKERTGCSRQAILKHVVANNKVDANKAAVQVRLCVCFYPCCNICLCAGQTLSLSLL